MAAVKNGYVSVSPMCNDHLNEDHIEDVKRLIQEGRV